MCMCVCVCVCMCVCVCACVFVAVSISWEFGGRHRWSRQCSLTRTPACDMVETTQQSARWWILANGVKCTGFWRVNMYNILDLWNVDKEMV